MATNKMMKNWATLVLVIISIIGTGQAFCGSAVARRWVCVASVKESYEHQARARLAAVGIAAPMVVCDLGTCGIYVSRRDAKVARQVLRRDARGHRQSYI